MKSLKKFGPVSVSESGQYDVIKSIGPLTISAPAVTANVIKSQGPAVIQSTLEVEDFSINGPATGSGKIKVVNFKVNGPLKFQGDIDISHQGKLNGPCNLDGSFSGNSEVEFKINGPCTFKTMTDFSYVKINGPTSGIRIKGINILYINGKTIVEEIQVEEKLTINLGRGESVIKTITGSNIEIGQLNESFTSKFFSRGEQGIAVIEEINSNGIVELDNVRVKKIIAKELYAGENTEIGEFVELED